MNSSCSFLLFRASPAWLTHGFNSPFFTFISSLGEPCDVSFSFSSSPASMRLFCIQYSITLTPSFGVHRKLPGEH